MSTAGQPDALVRRIEALAAAVADDTDDRPLVALVEALRAEVGALRAELAQAQAESGSVRSHLDDVRAALPALAREVRDGLEQGPARTTARVDAVAAELAARLDAVHAEVQRLAEAGAGRDGGAAVATAALAEVREAVEPRLAVLEESLGGLAERVEALARDGASTTIALLQSVQERVSGLERRLAETGSASVAAEGRAAQDREQAARDREQAARDREQAARDREQAAQDREQAAQDRAAALAQAAHDRAATEELAATVRSAVDRLSSLSPVVPTQAHPVDDDHAETHPPAHPPAAAAAPDELLRTVRSAVDGLHSGLEQVRGELAVAVSALTAELAGSAGGQERSAEQLRGELLGQVAELRDRLLQSTASSSDALTAALRAALDETRQGVTTSTAQLRDEVLARLQAQHQTVVDALRSAAAEVTGSTAELGQRLGVLTAVSDEVGHSVAAVSAGISAATEEMAAELRARADEEGVQTAARLLALDEQVRAQLSLARESWDERAAELSATLARGLSEIAEEVDIAATTTRDSSNRVTVLSELAEVQRTEVAQLLRSVSDDVVAATAELRAELLGRTAEQLGSLEAQLVQLGATVGAGTDELGGRLDAVAERVAQSRTALDGVAGRLDDLAVAAGRLDGTVSGLRDEWPTRTYEVVEGARAVAEAVVLDVRGEVSARLDEVRRVLEQALGAVGGARADLDDGTDRLARAGAVLVAYLEHRDRLLEAERDRVLHEVLEEFAAGLSSRDRSALAGRVSDAVARRKDARDAERYREALGEPVAPTAELPDDVRELAVRGDAGRAVPAAAPAGEPAAQGERTASDPEPVDGPPVRGHVEPGPPDAEQPPLPAAPPRRPPRAPLDPGRQPSTPAARAAGPVGRSVVPGPGRRTAPPGHSPAGADERPASERPASERPASARPGAASAPARGTTVRAAPGRSRSAAAPGTAAVPPSGAAARSVPGPGRARGRLGAMPQPPSVDVALDAAAPSADDR